MADPSQETRNGGGGVIVLLIYENYTIKTPLMT